MHNVRRGHLQLAIAMGLKDLTNKKRDKTGHEKRGPRPQTKTRFSTHGKKDTHGCATLL